MAHTYQYITSMDSPNFTRGRQGRPKIGETGHHWGDPRNEPKFEGVCAWLCNPRSQVSAHYVVTGTGRRVACLVDPEDTAWHAGNWTGNTQTIGIEMDPRCRPEDYDTAAELIAELWIAYGRMPIYPHRHWTATSCPGNYDLGRLEREAVVWYQRRTQPAAPAKQSVPGIQPLPSKLKLRTKLDRTELWDLETNPNYQSRKTFGKGEIVEVTHFIDFNGTRYYVSAFSAGRGLKVGINRNDVEVVVEQPPVPEWQRNLEDIADAKLTVLPAEGARVLNLTNLQFVNDTVIPRGTQVDIAKATTIGGKKYYLSSYAVAKGLPWGILADTLGTPAAPPANEKPEWMKNLRDIEDKEMWTRSETPVLRIADGEVVKRLPINSKVLITHATEMVGRDLLVVNGSEYAIETLYLNDKPVENPHDDLEKRVSALEKIVKAIADFLRSIFKNFGGKQ